MYSSKIIGAKADKIYYAKEIVDGRDTFKIRWKGFNSWTYKGSYNIVWKVILYDDNSKQFIKVSELPITKEKFINYGDDVLHKERAGIVNTKPVLKIWSDAEKMVAPTIVQTLVPKPTLTEMKEDISFNEDYIIAINKAVVEAVSKGSGIIKFIVSTDKGQNYKTWNGNSWVNVNKNNLDDIKNNGMIIDTIQGINKSQWNSLGLENKKLRFAFYMEIL